MKCPWVRNKYIPNEQGFIFFLINGEHFPLLLETNNAFRIFMVLLETKSTIVIKNSVQLPIYSLKFWSFSYLFLQVTWLFFFRATLLKFQATWLWGRWLSGDLTSYQDNHPTSLLIDNWQSASQPVRTAFFLYHSPSLSLYIKAENIWTITTIWQKGLHRYFLTISVLGCE